MSQRASRRSFLQKVGLASHTTCFRPAPYRATNFATAAGRVGKTCVPTSWPFTRTAA